MIKIPEINLHLGDCTELMRGKPNGFYDLAVVDPPYFKGAGDPAYYRSRLGKSKHKPITKTWGIPNEEYFNELLNNIKYLNKSLLELFPDFKDRQILSGNLNPKLENKAKGYYLESGLQKDAIESRALLNYMMVEVSSYLPFERKTEVFLRIHHRSGIFGLYCPPDPNCGSNFVSYGFRTSL